MRKGPVRWHYRKVAAVQANTYVTSNDLFVIVCHWLEVSATPSRRRRLRRAELMTLPFGSIYCGPGIDNTCTAVQVGRLKSQKNEYHDHQNIIRRIDSHFCACDVHMRQRPPQHHSDFHG